MIHKVSVSCSVPPFVRRAHARLKPCYHYYSQWLFLCAVTSRIYPSTPLNAALSFGYRGAYGELKLASLYSSRMTTPTEDAKASSAFFHTVDFTGAYGVSHFSSNTLRVPVCAVAPGRSGFAHPHALTACIVGGRLTRD